MAKKNVLPHNLWEFHPETKLSKMPKMLNKMAHISKAPQKKLQ